MNKVLTFYIHSKPRLYLANSKDVRGKVRNTMSVTDLLL